MTFKAVREMAIALERVEVTTSYGTPAFKVQGQLIARLHQDGDALVVGVDFEQRADLMASDAETYFITDHYVNYEWVLVRLARVHPEAMRDLLRGAWGMAVAGARKKRRARGK